MPKLHLSLLMTILSLSCFAQFRKYSNEFLNIGAGARGLAMGSAQVASVEDWNCRILESCWVGWNKGLSPGKSYALGIFCGHWKI